MGVKGLWSLLEQEARSVKLEALEGKVLVVDASIWLYQFVKAMRDDRGDAVKGAHVIGFLRRICKLLFNGIKPVFVFDGGVPELKKQTIAQRRHRRETIAVSIEKTAERLLNAQLKLHALSATVNDLHSISLRQNIVQTNRIEDEFELPEAKQRNGIDARLATEEEIRSFVDSQKDIDFAKVDINSIQFQALPATLQHEIILDLKNRSRAPNQARVEKMLSNSNSALDFSNEQIKNLVHRATLTDRYHKSLKINVKHVAGSRQKDFVLTKINEGVGGWSFKANEIGGSKVIDNLDGLDGFGKKENQTKHRLAPPSDLEKYIESDNRLDEININEFIYNWDRFAPVNFKFYYKNNEINTDILKKSESALEILGVVLEKRINSAEGEELLAHQYYKDFVSKCLELKQRFKDYENPLTSINAIELDTPFPKFECDEGIIEPVSQTPNQHNAQQNAIELDTPFPKFECDEGIIEPVSQTPNQQNAQQIILESDSESENIFEATNLKSDLGLELVDHKVSSESFKVEENDEIFHHSIFDTEKLINLPAEENIPGGHTSSQISSISEVSNNVNNHNNQLTGQFKNVEDSDESEEFENIEWKAPTIDLSTEQSEEESSANISINHFPLERGIKSNENHGEVDQNFLSKTDIEIEARKNIELLNESEEIANIDVPILLESEKRQFFEENTSNTLESSFSDAQDLITILTDRQKRDMRDFAGISSDMVREIQTLLRYFGIPYEVAPMEAESQCAYLFQKKLVDGIITDDSDVFLFGGSKVYRNMFSSQKYVECFEMGNFLNLGLSRENLVQMAYFLGSDYTVGIKGLGPVTSIEILSVWEGEKLEGLIKFRDWVKKMQLGQFSDLDTELQMRLRNVCKKLEFPDNFPDPRIFESYMNPIVEESTSSFSWGDIQLDELRKFLMDSIGWNQENIDKLILPVVKSQFQRRKGIRQTQIDEFFPLIPRSHKSKRVQRAIRGRKKQKR